MASENQAPKTYANTFRNDSRSTQRRERIFRLQPWASRSLSPLPYALSYCQAMVIDTYVYVLATARFTSVSGGVTVNVSFLRVDALAASCDVRASLFRPPPTPRPPAPPPSSLPHLRPSLAYTHVPKHLDHTRTRNHPGKHGSRRTAEGEGEEAEGGGGRRGRPMTCKLPLPSTCSRPHVTTNIIRMHVGEVQQGQRNRQGGATETP